MKLWYYPRMFRQLPENEMKAAFQPVEIPDDEGKKRLCEHNQLISYEYAMHLQNILGGSKPEGPQKWVSTPTMESASPDSP